MATATLDRHIQEACSERETFDSPIICFYVNGDNLTWEDKSILDDPAHETAVASLVDCLTLQEQIDIGKLFVYKNNTRENFLHYLRFQKPGGEWFEKEKYLTEQKLGRTLSDEEVMGAFTEHHNMERYRIWYTLKFPEKMRLFHEKSSGIDCGTRRLGSKFFRLAEQVLRRDYADLISACHLCDFYSSCTPECKCPVSSEARV